MPMNYNFLFSLYTYGITLRILKKNHKFILKLLAIKLFFSTGKVLSLLETSVITPIYKKSCKSDISKYRSISSITIFAKYM